MTLLQLLTIVMGVTLLIMAAFLFATIQANSNSLSNQLEERNLTILRQEKEIQRLTTIIASKDPMTFQVLSTPQTNSLNSDPSSTYLTDEQEALQWAVATGKVNPDGTTDDLEDLSDDLQMLGLG